MADIKNGRCFDQQAQMEPPLIQHGSVVLAAHDIGWIITGCLTAIAVVISFWLVDQHLQWYTNKLEQRYIIRILFMVPIYAIISFASYLFWNHSTALLLIRDCYEAFVLTSFFYLILNYLSPDPDEQKDIFRKVGLSRQNDRDALRRGVDIPHWVFPLQFIRWKPEDGLFFLQLMKWGVLQYCVIRPTTTLAAVILNYVGLYCDDSWGPGWGHLYITVVMSISVTIAMYRLLQLYIPISGHLAPHKPLLKLFAVKAVVFLTFWQEAFISALEDFGVIKDTKYMTADNIATGISAILETFEMVLFAFLHIRAYTYKVYRSPPSRTNRWRSLVDAMNFMETLREIWAGIVYMFHRMRGQETDVRARREGIMEDVFGKSRFDIVAQARAGNEKSTTKRPRVVSVHGDEVDYVDEERRLLGFETDRTHDRIGRGEKGNPLETEELGKRGYKRRETTRFHSDIATYARVETTDLMHYSPPPHRREHSWWKNMYSRVPRISNDDGHDASLPGQRREVVVDLPSRYTYDDPPPPSVMRTFRDSQRRATGPVLLLSPPASPHATHVHPPPVAMPSPLLLDHAQPRVPSMSPQVAENLSQSPTSNADVTSLNPPSPSTARDSDSFLQRAFLDLPPASSVEASSTGPSSSQSHRTQIRFTGEPQIQPQEVDAMRSPVLLPPGVHLSVTSPVVRNVRSSMPQDRRSSDISSTPTSPRHAAHPHPSTRLSRTVYPTNSMPPTNRHIASNSIESKAKNAPVRPRFAPRRDQIVLPAPLAPTHSPPSSSHQRTRRDSESPRARAAPTSPSDAQPSPTRELQTLDLPLNALFPPHTRQLNSPSHPSPLT